MLDRWQPRLFVNSQAGGAYQFTADVLSTAACAGLSLGVVGPIDARPLGEAADADARAKGRAFAETLNKGQPLALCVRLFGQLEAARGELTAAEADAAEAIAEIDAGLLAGGDVSAIERKRTEALARGRELRERIGRLEAHVKDAGDRATADAAARLKIYFAQRVGEAEDVLTARLAELRDAIRPHLAKCIEADANLNAAKRLADGEPVKQARRHLGLASPPPATGK